MLPRMSSTWWNTVSKPHGQPLTRQRRCWTTLPRDTPPYRSKRPWPDWQRSLACTAWKISSRFSGQWFVFVLHSEMSLLWFVQDVRSCVTSVNESVIHSGIAWIEFLNSTDTFGDILTHLREGDMKGAQLIWLRYEVTNNEIRKSFIHSSE